ncbi:MAG: GHKL domain-containing protein [Solobacterium sp.]|nr:GHKL domain-containing protein [Solobacterium sp.]
MDYIDLLINTVENVLFAFLTSAYIEIKGRKRIIYILVFTLLLTVPVTFLNMLTIYEGLLAVSYILFDVILMYWFNEKVPIFSIIIYAVILETFVSLGSEIVYLLFYVFMHLSPMEVLLTIDGYMLFFLSRIIIVSLMLLINRFDEKYKLLKTKYDAYFCLVFLIMFFIITSLETLIVEETHFVLLIIINLALMTITLFIYYIYCKSSMQYFDKMQFEKLNSNLKSIRSTDDSFRQKEKEIRRMKHDLINQLSIINGYLEVDEADKAREYIQNNIEELEKITLIKHTGYTAIDAIVSNKITKAKEDGIQVRSMIRLDKIDTNMEYDIAIILGNLLDNAIENIGTDKKEIELKLIQKDSIQITVTNTTDKEKTDLKTRKKDVENHGIGLNTVELIANRHNGFTVVDLKNKVFSITVILYTD